MKKCPSNHHNPGNDICADCGADLNPPKNKKVRKKSSPKVSPGPYTVQPLAGDHGASLAIVDKESNVLAIIPPLNEDEEPDESTAKRGPHDEANAKLFADSWETRRVLKELVRCIRGGDKTRGVSMDTALQDADEILG